MKDRIRNLAISAGVAALLCAPMLQGQDAMEVANVPFDFQVNQATMPAGAYTLYAHLNGSTLQLRNEDTGKSILILPPGRDTGKSEAQLVFHRYGNHYFLAEIWSPAGEGYSLKKTSLERELEKGDGRPTMAYIPIVRQ